MHVWIIFFTTPLLFYIYIDPWTKRIANMVKSWVLLCLILLCFVLCIRSKIHEDPTDTFHEINIYKKWMFYSTCTDKWKYHSIYSCNNIIKRTISILLDKSSGPRRNIENMYVRTYVGIKIRERRMTCLTHRNIFKILLILSKIFCHTNI